MYQLPWWMQWIQAIAVLSIAGVGAWIALKQAMIAEAKLRLELYEKRFKVFEATRKLFDTILMNGHAETKEIIEFNVAVVDAIFLFDKDVQDFLSRFRFNANRLRDKHYRATRANDDDPTRGKLIDEEGKLFEAIGNQFEELESQFKPYLHFGVLRVRSWFSRNRS